MTPSTLSKPSSQWRIPSLSWPWRITITYLSLMLFIPVTAMLLKSSTLGWDVFWQEATNEVALAAYDVTFITSLIAALINGVFGTLVAWVLVRYNFPLKRFLDAVVDLPFALPTSVAGLTLASVYSDNGWVGHFFAANTPLGSLFGSEGLLISFTRLGVGVAMVFISFPFVVRTVQPVLTEADVDVEEAAWCLGASQWQTFWRVIFPPLLPSILTGIALGFSRAVGEYGSTVIIASNLPFKDLIAPVLIIQQLEQYNYTGATVIGTVMLFISLILLFLINLLQAWGRRYDQ